MHTETITIGAGARPGSLTAHVSNGPHKVLVAVRLPGQEPQLHRDGAALREVLPSADSCEVLDLLAVGHMGEYEIYVGHPFHSRRDDDFEVTT